MLAREVVYSCIHQRFRILDRARKAVNFHCLHADTSLRQPHCTSLQYWFVAYAERLALGLTS